jgi:hypothetical protein
MREDADHAMRTRLKLKPGQRGTKRLLAEYGERLLCVRYRYDEATRKRYKTIELIVDIVDWEPKTRPDTIVGISVEYREADIRQRVKQAGGKWNPVARQWRIRYATAVALGLEDRIVRL